MSMPTPLPTHLPSQTTSPAAADAQRRTWSRAGVLSVLASVAAIGTAALHFIGDVQHRHYLGFWGIDAGLFPKPVDWMLVNGYYGLFDRIVAVVITIFENLVWLPGVALVLAFYFYVLRMPLGPDRGALPAWLQRLPQRIQRPIAYLLVSAAVVAVLPCAAFILAVVIATPAALGESAGKSVAEAAMANFRKGCDGASRPCVALQRDGEVLAQGFVLDSSPSHIALLEVPALTARIVSLEKLEIVSLRSPAPRP